MDTFKPRSEEIPIEELLLERKSFITNDVKTSLTLLSSNEEKIVLKAIGILSRCATKDEKLLVSYVSFGIYQKLLQLLDHNNITILKFAMKLLAMLSKKQYLDSIGFNQVLICSELATRFYIETQDAFVRECASFILLQHVKYNEIISNQIYSDELMCIMFKIFAAAEELDTLWNSLNLLDYLLDVEMAKEDVFRNTYFSTKVLICLLHCEQEGVRSVTLNILHKLSRWRYLEMSLTLIKGGILPAMLNILLEDDRELTPKAMDIIQNCMCHENCALKFSRSLEFREFIVWLKTCSNRNLLRVLPILEILTKIPEIRERLYDLCFDQMVLSWLKYALPEFVSYLLKIISNLSEHKRYCKTFAKFSVIKTITSYINPNGLPLQAYGEMALHTLKKLIVRMPETLQFFVCSGGVNLIKTLFVEEGDNLTEEGFKTMIQFLEILITSKYADKILALDVFERLFYVYNNNSDFMIKMLSFINILAKHKIFQYYILECNRINDVLDMLKRDKTALGTQMHLQVLSNLAKYQDIGSKLLELDVIAFLQKVKCKINLTVLDDIIKDLYDYCLTLKFYETNRLERHNKIDDNFYLMQEEVPKISPTTFDYSSSEKPVYVASVMLLKVTRELELSSSNIKSIVKIEAEKDNIQRRERVLSTACLISETNLRIRISYQHGEIPENILMNRKTNNSNKESIFYEDYYLERYILTLMKELYFSDDAPETLRERVEYIAKYVARQLSGVLINLKEKEKVAVFQQHIRALQESIGTNVIPIGYLRMGFQCEKALLFKVLCDNVCVPTTLCKDHDVYWNEIRFTVKRENGKFVKEEGGSVYIVDLVKNVGNLIPLNSLEAEEYLKPYKKGDNKK